MSDDIRYILRGSARYLSGPSQATENVLIHCGQGQGTFETRIRLLNYLFEARRRLQIATDACKMESSSRVYVESDGHGSNLSDVQSSWQRFHSTFVDPGIQGMASTMADGWRHMSPSTGILPEIDGRDHSTIEQAQVRGSGRPTGEWSTPEDDPGQRECLELPLLGWIGQMSSQPLASTKVKDLMIQFSQLAARTELIQRFPALKPLSRDQIPDNAQVTVPQRLDILIRSESSQHLIEILDSLSGGGVGQTGLQRSPFATTIAHRVRR